jgi:hypothetical protein
MKIEKNDLIAFRVNTVLMFGFASAINDDNVVTADDKKIDNKNILGVIVDLSRIKAFLTELKNKNYEQIFRADFIKRTTGEYRMMVCKFGVIKHLAGGTKSFNDEDKEIKTVFDMQKNGYRSISLENILLLGFDGKRYIARENMDLLAGVLDQVK